MDSAKKRLEEWAKHSSTLAYIAECLKQVMTEEIAGWIMRDGKTAQGLWNYITEQAKALYQHGTEGVLFSPPQMQEAIYAYLKQQEPASSQPVANDENNMPAEDHSDQMGLRDMIEDNPEQPSFV